MMAMLRKLLKEGPPLPRGSGFNLLSGIKLNSRMMLQDRIGEDAAPDIALVRDQRDEAVRRSYSARRLRCCGGTCCNLHRARPAVTRRRRRCSAI